MALPIVKESAINFAGSFSYNIKSACMENEDNKNH
jgi:hypothetical protein